MSDHPRVVLRPGEVISRKRDHLWVSGKEGEEDLGRVKDQLGLHDAVETTLFNIGEDPDREGLRDTPKRVAAALEFWTRGYGQDPAKVLKVFEDGADNYNEMVVQKDIPLWSLCEHHIAPFFGVAHVAYIPQGRIVGLSKITRLVNVFARRLQVQERLTTQISDALFKHLAPLGVAVHLSCRHACMESRGIQTAGTTTQTTALHGVFMTKPEARAEFLAAIR